MKTPKQLLKSFCLDGKISAQHAKDIEKILEEAIREIWIDGFMESGEGFNGEYCGGHGGNGVRRKDVAEIYDKVRFNFEH